jgi:hypothetical protein
MLRRTSQNGMHHETTTQFLSTTRTAAAQGSGPDLHGFPYFAIEPPLQHGKGSALPCPVYRCSNPPAPQAGKISAFCLEEGNSDMEVNPAMERAEHGARLEICCLMLFRRWRQQQTTTYIHALAHILLSWCDRRFILSISLHLLFLGAASE